MKNKNIWKILAILLVFVIVASCMAPCIAIDNRSANSASSNYSTYENYATMPVILSPLPLPLPSSTHAKRYHSNETTTHAHPPMPFEHKMPPNEAEFLDPFARDEYFNHTRPLLEDLLEESLRPSSTRGSSENASQQTLGMVNQKFSESIVILSSNTIYVPDDYAQIQWAVDNASAGDTIIVRDGSYNENVNVNKRLTIRSENGTATCIVSATNPGGHVFEVTANYVNMSGFIIADATEYSKAGVQIGDGVVYCNISDNNVSNNFFGIHLDNSSYNVLQNNNVSNNFLGIYLDKSSSNMVTNNNANMNEKINIVLDSSSSNILTNNTASSSECEGIYIFNSNNNTITNNTASENLYGICMVSSCDNNLTGNIANANTGELGGITLLGYSNDSTLTSNIVSNNSQYGIYLFYSCNNNISCNNVNSNSDYGIYLDDSSNNLIYNNYFNNTNNAYDNETNIWNISKISGASIIGGSWLGGNYWSDYNGSDTNGDGLGDTLLPYNFSGDLTNCGDHLPLVPIAPLQFGTKLESGWNFISVPLNLTTWELGEAAVVGDHLNVTPANSITSIYRYNTTSGLFEKCSHYDDWGWWPATGSESFTELEPGRGYWVMAKNNCNLTFTGTEPSDLNITLNTSWNLVGWYTTSEALLGQESVVGDPLNVTPKNSLTSIYRYNCSNCLFEKCSHYDDWGWWPATGSEGFTKLEPGKGYWVMAKNDCEWRHAA